MNDLENIKKLFSKQFIESPLIETYEAGKLHISSGRIIACDPVVTPDKTAFNEIFPKGDFTVLIHKEKSSDCIAYAEVSFGTDKIESWTMALCDNQNLKDLEKGEIFGFPVESGMAAIMDIETQNLVNQLEQDLYNKKGEEFMGLFEEFFQPYFYDSEGAIDQFAMMKPYDDNTHNLATFEAGYGEGFYATYIGYNKDKQPQKLVTEFIEIQ